MGLLAGLRMGLWAGRLGLRIGIAYVPAARVPTGQRGAHTRTERGVVFQNLTDRPQDVVIGNRGDGVAHVVSYSASAAPGGYPKRDRSNQRREDPAGQSDNPEPP